jgi:hypothetical protein
MTNLFGSLDIVIWHYFGWTGKPSYETTSKWHSFFLDQTGRSRPAAGLKSDIKTNTADGHFYVPGL